MHLVGKAKAQRVVKEAKQVRATVLRVPRLLGAPLYSVAQRGADQESSFLFVKKRMSVLCLKSKFSLWNGMSIILVILGLLGAKHSQRKRFSFISRLNEWA
jgi:hypothetical protein